MKKLIFCILILIFSCDYEYNKPLYQVGDIVIIKPDSARVEILYYITWKDSTKYKVEYIDTVRKNIIHEEEIINYE